MLRAVLGRRSWLFLNIWSDSHFSSSVTYGEIFAFLQPNADKGIRPLPIDNKIRMSLVELAFLEING